jgi:hypothetical protein
MEAIPKITATATISVGSAHAIPPSKEIFI